MKMNRIHTNKTKAILATLALLVGMAAAQPQVAQAAQGGSWKYDNGWWYRHSDGSYPHSCFETIDGQTYYFNGSGYMVRGWRQVGGYWYHFDGNGCMHKNTTVGGYYLDGQGRYVSGGHGHGGGGHHGQGGRWRHDGGWWYCHNDGSYPHSCFQTIDGQTYYFNGSGYMVTGWKYINNYWYYFNSNGCMLKNTTVGGWKLDGQGRYVADSSTSDDTNNQQQQAGWRHDSTGWWYRNADGSYPRSTFQTIAGQTYYFNGSGYMATGWKKIGSYWYYFNSNGYMQKNTTIDGWKLDGQGRYVADSSTSDDTSDQGNHNSGDMIMLEDGQSIPYPSFDNTQSGRARKKAIDTGLSLRGRRYGSSVQGYTLDCSGFTRYCYHTAGSWLDPWAAGQGRQGTKISLSQAKPGDVLHYYANGGNHVGLYMGQYNGKHYWIHSNSGVGHVSVQEMTQWRIDNANVRRIL